MRRRVALREDDYLLTACLTAEGRLLGWSAAGLLGREAFAGPVLFWLSREKASVSSSAHWQLSSGPQSFWVPNTKRMVPTSQGDSAKYCSHPYPTSSLINPPQQGSLEDVPSWFSGRYCHPLNLRIPTLGLDGGPLLSFILCYSKEPCDLWGSLFSYALVSLFVQWEETNSEKSRKGHHRPAAVIGS